MANKGEVLTKFKTFKAWAETQSGRKIKILRCDNGKEYLSKEFDNFLAQNGIQRQLTAPYCPEQNGVAERVNRTVIEKARSMMHDKDIPIAFWAEAVSTAVYLKNRSPTKSLLGKVPEELWMKQKISIAHLRVFGCTAYAHIPKEKRTKLEKKATKCMFLGYCEDSKAYRLLNLETRQIMKSRDVIFDEQTGGLTEIHKDQTPAEKQTHVIETQDPVRNQDNHNHEDETQPREEKSSTIDYQEDNLDQPKQ